jgi:hypothetical protein
MFEKFSRSWDLIKASGAVLRQDKELLLFPLLSSLAAILVGLSFALPMVASDAFAQLHEGGELQPLHVVLGFAFYLSLNFVIFYFNAALVGAAMIRLDGGDPTVSDGLRIANSKLGPILGYAAIAATVGLLLRMIEERAGFIGRWVVGLIGVAFTLATFLVVPLLVSRDIGPIDAVKESATMLKKTWGENIIGNVGMGLVFGLVYIALTALGVATVAGLINAQSGLLAFTAAAVFVTAGILLALVQAALQGVYSAALFKFSTAGSAGVEFNTGLLDSAFRTKK